MKRKFSLAGLLLIMFLSIGAGWGGWQLLLARTGPAVQLLPSMVRNRLAACGGTYVPLSEMPPMMLRAVVSTEDNSFWSNPGIDPAGIARSLVADVTTFSLEQGGSTITQELVRNMLLNPKKTLGRKIKEMLLALVVTHYYSKDAILEMYLNEIYLGHGANGVELAARIYFNATPDAMSPAQCVMLAGLPQAPSLYDPLVNLHAARERQREVLDSMVQSRYISAAEADQIYAKPLGLSR
ncbi:penicillin-binding protein 2D [Peptococcaceae bacterium CEB3]|nr:penicillin-binding protein 2D [Peptococcaceae bacterium CEB3]